MPKSRICLFFSDTGGGHRHAMQAIAAGLHESMSSRSKNEELILTIENVVEKSHPINRWFVDLYNYLLRHHQAHMKYYYWFLHVLAPNNSDIGYFLVAGYFKKLIVNHRPSVIASVHPMTNHYLARAIKDLGLAHKVKLIVTVTDPNEKIWKGWACPDADLIIAPNDLARNKLVKDGISPEKIKIIGMPIHPDFLKPIKQPREKFLATIGLGSQLPTICINAGWAGGGNALQIYKALFKTKANFQVVFLCGHNELLYQQIYKLASTSKIPTAVLKFCTSMPDLMSACDLMITKAGGLTTFEAIAKRLPLVLDLITEAMPQEQGTAEMLIQQKFAQPIYCPEDIVKIVESVKIVYDRQSITLPSAHNLDHTNAVYEIAQTILAACNPLYDLVSEVEMIASDDTVYGIKHGRLGFEGPLA